jgi:hypothetical protein
MDNLQKAYRHWLFENFQITPEDGWYNNKINTLEEFVYMRDEFLGFKGETEVFLTLDKKETRTKVLENPPLTFKEWKVTKFKHLLLEKCNVPLIYSL